MMGCMARTRKNFLLTDAEQRLLKSLSVRMACTETDVVRWGLVALRELMLDGFASTTKELRGEDARLLTFRSADRLRSSTFYERPDGSFGVGAEGHATTYASNPGEHD